MSVNNEIMTINLAKGHFNVVDGHSVLKVNFRSVVLPCQRYSFNIMRHEARLPDIAAEYQDCVTIGMSNDEIIDELVRLYFPLRFFREADYKNMALVIGLIGMRGSGKTCSAVMIAVCDFLLRGLPVWSNVPIAVRVVYKDAEKIFTSIPLDELDILDLTEDYGGGCVLYDEVNMEAAESTRFSSGANLKFAYAMQQIRKRQLSLIWTCQGWSWIDNRLRWQTDFAVSCRDLSFEKKKQSHNGLGDKSLWRIHDLSGTSGRFPYDFELRHKYLTDFMVGTMTAWLRPWWHSYNTNTLQGQRDYVSAYKVSQAQKAKAEASMLPGPSGALPEHTNTLDGAVNTLIEATGGQDIACADAWSFIGTKDKAIQIKIGRLFALKGYERAGDSKSGRYWRKINQEVIE